MSTATATVTNQKTSVYFDPVVKNYLQFRAIKNKKTVSGLINEHFLEAMEDSVDIAAAEKHRNDETISFEEMLSKLGLTNDDLQD
jgi:hypothetical protein